MSDTPSAAAEAPESGIRTDFKGRMSYGDYLGLDRLLTAQHPRSDAHDEMLFIIIHQAKELWMKLMIHEIRAAITAVQSGDLGPAFKGLARFSRIQEQMIKAWDVLSTMTPADYLSFRPALGESSGFQSHQYRTIEFLLGAKDRRMMGPHRHRPMVFAELQATLEAPDRKSVV